MEARAFAGDGAGETAEFLAKLGVEPELFRRGAMETHSLITGETIGRVEPNDAASAKFAIDGANDAFRACRRTSAPRRGEFVRLLGEELPATQPELARLATIEAGKITSESLGEVRAATSVLIRRRLPL